ncbi:hypothetical protein ACPPVO_54470 [Dactylosporangium sp. McL0621]|uniref:hypothetical protein n=1 Tax=Dactylosporangium sp. McL0621 TaxID=3415678 RepID=UPI003CEB0A4D
MCVEEVLSANAAEPVAARTGPPAFVIDAPDTWGWPSDRPLDAYRIAADRTAPIVLELAADPGTAAVADLFVHAPNE